MVLIEWGPELETGVAGMDREHRDLVAQLNDLHAALEIGRAGAHLRGLLDRLLTYTEDHFAHEERLMADHDYPERHRHTLEHQKLRAQVRKYQLDYQEGRPSLSVELMSFLRTWLIEHVKGSDKTLGAYLAGRGVR